MRRSIMPLLQASRLAFVVLTAGLLALTAAPSLATQDARSQRDEMLQLFGSIPDAADLHNFYPFAIYMDVEALERIHRFEVPFATERDPQWISKELGRWATILSRFVVDPVDPPPFVLEPSAARMDAEAGEDASGLSAFFAIDRVLVLGWPVLDGNSYKASQAGLVGYGGGDSLTDPEGLDVALRRRGFVRQPKNRPFWTRADDHTKAEIDDLLGRVVERAKEVLVVGDNLMMSPMPGILGSLFSSGAWRHDTLADDRDVRALIEALTDRNRLDGTLVQSWFFEGIVTLEMATLGSLGPYVTEEQRRIYSSQLQNSFDSALPEYRWFAAAELQDGDEELLVIALSFEGLELAERAAEIVAHRFSEHRSIRYKRHLHEVFDIRTESHVHLSEDGARAVAVVTVRHDYPARAEIDMSRHGKLAKAIFEDLEWQRLIPLVVSSANEPL